MCRLLTPAGTVKACSARTELQLTTRLPPAPATGAPQEGGDAWATPGSANARTPLDSRTLIELRTIVRFTADPFGGLFNRDVWSWCSQSWEAAEVRVAAWA